MKHFLLAALLLLLAGCGAAPETSPEVPSEPAPEVSAEPAPEETAQAAYAALLSGDASLLDAESAALHGLENWKEFIQYEDFTYEYTCMDLDGDGTEELLIQMEDDPVGYSGVFHYAGGKLFCWRNDTVEMSCRDYPLRDGTMVRQYDYSDTSTYNLFRYRSDGNAEMLTTLYSHGSPLDPDDNRTFPCYGIDRYGIGREELTEAEFEEQLEALVTSQRLERSAWKTI